jgi:hypothetical protein
VNPFEQVPARDLPIVISRMSVGTWRHFAGPGATMLEVQRTKLGTSITAATADGRALWYGWVRRDGLTYAVHNHGGTAESIHLQHVDGLISALSTVLVALSRGVGSVVREAMDEPVSV